MALPFVLGLVTGAAAVVAFNNKNELKDMAQKGLEKGKEIGEDIKDTAKGAAECIKEKIDKEKCEKNKTEDTPVQRGEEKEKDES